LSTLAEQVLSRCKLLLRQESPFFAVLSMFAGYRFDDKVALAQTDGRNIYLHPEAFLALTDAARVSLLLHLTLHAALQHPLRQRTRDPALWNIACDVMVNHIISTQTAFAPPLGTAQARDLVPTLVPESAERVYEWLQQHRVAASSVQTRATTVDPLADRTPAADPSRSDSTRKNVMSAAFAKRFGAGPAVPADPVQTPASAPPVTTITGQLRDLRPADDYAGAAALQTHWEGALLQAKQSIQERQRGVKGAALLRELEAALSPQLDWRTLLWRFMVCTPTDFAGYDRRFLHAGLYLENLEQDTVRLHVAIDTSGSVDDDTLLGIGAELTGILGIYPHLQCDLYFCDTEVHGPFALRADMPIPKARGGGGTDFRPFFRALEENQFQRPIDAAIYFTDGMGPFPDHAPAFPLLWVAVPGAEGNEHFPFGAIIRM
jgi:predicted metal-dependent peptidase